MVIYSLLFNMERIISVTSFKFLEDELYNDYEDELKEVQKLIDKNILIMQAYFEENLETRSMVSVKHAKVMFEN
jgi:type III secretory pathway component EscV